MRLSMSILLWKLQRNINWHMLATYSGLYMHDFDLQWTCQEDLWRRRGGLLGRLGDWGFGHGGFLFIGIWDGLDVAIQDLK